MVNERKNLDCPKEDEGDIPIFRDDISMSWNYFVNKRREEQRRKESLTNSDEI